MQPLLRSILREIQMLFLPKLRFTMKSSFQTNTVLFGETEIEAIQEFFLKRKIDKDSIDETNIKTLYSEKLIGISIPIK